VCVATFVEHRHMLRAEGSQTQDTSTSGLVVEHIVAIDVTRVRSLADAGVMPNLFGAPHACDKTQIGHTGD